MSTERKIKVVNEVLAIINRRWHVSEGRVSQPWLLFCFSVRPCVKIGSLVCLLASNIPPLTLLFLVFPLFYCTLSFGNKNHYHYF
jgi:hypothetical protein